jgi:tetratricopeptide (TPR) repeat protein
MTTSIVASMPMIVIKKHGVSIDTKSLGSRITFSILICLLAVPAMYQSYKIFLSDRIALSGETVSNFTRALQYDPSNAQLWWKRGRLHHYSVENVELNSALHDYQMALDLNPRMSQAWVDLADVYERMGRTSEAESALNKAFDVHTYSPLIRWQAGNFFLRRGNLPKMYECFKIACRYDVSKMRIATELAWKIDPEHSQILYKLVPDTLPANMDYLNFLVARGELELARPVWQRCLKNEIPQDYELKPYFAFNYVDHLVAKNLVTDALRVWNGILLKAETGLSDSRWKNADGSQNLVWNGSFENEIMRGGFDWCYRETPEIKFQVDIENRMNGLKSLQADFEKGNISGESLHQIVPVMSPGDYVLDFYVQTKNLTTDQMPYFFIQGHPDPGGAAGQSNPFPSTTSWIKLSFPFTVKEGCKAVRLSMMRNRSTKIDNKISGSLWLDEIVIRKLGPDQPGKKTEPENVN